MKAAQFLSFLAAFLPVVYGAPADVAGALHPDILASMKRDLGLDADAAVRRSIMDDAHTKTLDGLMKRSPGFAGGFIEGENLHVVVRDEAHSADVIAAGAIPVVRRDLAKLEEAQKALDAIFTAEVSTLSTSKEGVAAYWVDIASGKLVFEALEANTANAAALAAQVGLADEEFEVTTTDEMPQTFINIVGGAAYLVNNSWRCSIGFGVTGGFITAGHCGASSGRVTTTGGTALGTFQGFSFPGNDMGWASVTSAHTPTNDITGSSVQIRGSTQAAVGSTASRSGSTTGVRSGTISAYGATVNYAEGSVSGLIRTTICAEPGDSGGSMYTSAGQAQGVTSGGSGNCASGGTTYFQPVNPILSRYGLTLRTT